MPVRINRMKQKLREGQPVFGGLLRTPEPSLVEVLGYAGYDYVVLDAEHGAHSFEALDTLILSAYASNVTPVVRINDNAPGLIMRVLDLGAQGVLVPHIRNADDARRAVSAALYPPDGSRGIGPNRGSQFGAIPNDEYFKSINQEVAVMLMMEEAGAVEAIDAITDVKGITALSIGLSDLSGSLGVPGQANHPSVQAAVDTLMGMAARKGIPVSLSVRGIEEVRDALKRGARLASIGTLETVLYQALKGWLQHVTA
ncbi:MAG TPA: aldolase/citrate lyase family protein [Candidatus Tectomicrobia bacterium]|jgi:2-keto-3-deoxy-L-rhamnonate aldolase RhmA|nr:aldolase/citrate lyase family protein [Candidatus Tectomicrobia bacterium]